jgi:hypothetical protein
MEAFVTVSEPRPRRRMLKLRCAAGWLAMRRCRAAGPGECGAAAAAPRGRRAARSASAAACWHAAASAEAGRRGRHAAARRAACADPRARQTRVRPRPRRRRRQRGLAAAAPSARGAAGPHPERPPLLRTRGRGGRRRGVPGGARGPNMTAAAAAPRRRRALRSRARARAHAPAPPPPRPTPPPTPARSLEASLILHTAAAAWFLRVWLWHLTPAASVLPGAHGFGWFVRFLTFYSFTIQTVTLCIAAADDWSRLVRARRQPFLGTGSSQGATGEARARRPAGAPRARPGPRQPPPASATPLSPLPTPLTSHPPRPHAPPPPPAAAQGPPVVALHEARRRPLLRGLCARARGDDHVLHDPDRDQGHGRG